ncbi:MAG: hypothetical protein QF842_07235 [Candidatus Marinimicrobia bacterium]|jgi:tetratricopeptide (TPR) repeat protein|nr:hypothetical protein [Candidatus Neomarinimicrobiota bacterium]MDP6611316.1 hypothetical protein [Candidatus Neomarinimicrobiota bacterium]|tara:strand:- start:885 stop:1952 length:1068 start_codon:yes stop_codon:yes gene_type:complete
MKNKFQSKFPILFLVLSISWAQEQYISPEDIKSEWRNYTSFQKQELVNFATFLYNEGFYERALLSYFQFLYKHPKDELELAAYFQIGKCYESLENWDLARNYYLRILDEGPPQSVAASAARYQLYYISLMNEDYRAIIDSTENSDDPYELIFRAYAHFELLEMTEARQAFQAAEALFDHSHYTNQIKPWYKAIKTAESAPLKEKTPALLSSLAPGGGFIYLKQTENAVGSMGASFLLYTAIFTMPSLVQKGGVSVAGNRQSLVPLSGGLETKDGVFQSSPGYPIPDQLSLESKRGLMLVPPALFAMGLYAGSMWKAVHDIDESNRKLIRRFAGRVTVKLPIERFMDYNTPDFIIK